MFQRFKLASAFLEGATTAVITHIVAWFVRAPIDKLYHKILYFCGHITVTLVALHLFENR